MGQEVDRENARRSEVTGCTLPASVGRQAQNLEAFAMMPLLRARRARELVQAG